MCERYGYRSVVTDVRATLKNEQAIAILSPHWPAKAKADHWATLVIDLLQLQRDFDTLFSKHWLTPADLGESARFVDM